jgi:hypothetical protein
MASPYAFPRRPATLTAAGRILMGIAIGCGVEAVVDVAATIRIGQVAQQAFVDVPASATGVTGTATIVGAMMVAVVAFAISTVVTGILAGGILRGNATVRIWTWILGGLSLLWVLASIGGKSTAALVATPSATDAAHPRVVAALAEIRAEIPRWYVGLGVLFDVLTAFGLIAVIVLISLPPSNEYVRARRVIRR